MKIEDLERIAKRLRQHPVWTSVCLVLLVLLFVAYAYLSEYFGEKGRQSASFKQAPEKNNHDLDAEIDSQMPPGIAIKQLIEDYAIELQQYYNNFLRDYEKIEDDFINKKSSRSPLDETIFSDARLGIIKRTLELERKIRNILLKKGFGTSEFGAIKTLSKEYEEYLSALEKSNSLEIEINKMERDPSRITSLFNRINNKQR